MAMVRRGIRIVGGAKRSRRLEVPLSTEVRPTSDMVREAVFDVLGPVAGLKALDLFAGTGALGLEALSRGARDCVFVEHQRAAGAILQSNIDALQYGDRSRVLPSDYLKAVEYLVGAGENFDLLFVDPPYRMLAEVEATLEPMVPRLLSTEGVMVIESARASCPRFGLSLVFERQYGDTKITIVRPKRGHA